jgi:hypothetical protein
MRKPKPGAQSSEFMGSIKMVFGVALIAMMAIVLYRLVPVYVSEFELEDAIKNDALHATYSTKSEEEIREAVIKHAKDYDIQLTPKQVHVQRNGGFGNGTLNIECDYSVPLDFPGYSTTVEFHPSSKNQGVF